jgi:hypothetical protein
MKPSLPDTESLFSPVLSESEADLVDADLGLLGSSFSSATDSLGNIDDNEISGDSADSVIKNENFSVNENSLVKDMAPNESGEDVDKMRLYLLRENGRNHLTGFEARKRGIVAQALREAHLRPSLATSHFRPAGISMHTFAFPNKR